MAWPRFRAADIAKKQREAGTDFPLQHTKGLLRTAAVLANLMDAKVVV